MSRRGTPFGGLPSPRLRGGSVRPSKRAYALALGALVLFGVGANVQAGWLYVLGAAMVGVVAAGLAVPGLAVHGLAVSRRTPARARMGDAALVELEVRSRTRAGRGALEGVDAFLEPTPFVVGRMRPGTSAARLRYEVACTRRGVLEGAEVTIASGAPFGIGIARRRLFVPSPVIVHPRWAPLASFPLLEAASTPHEPLHERRRKGAGLDFFGIREYRPGDSLRHVHWRSTARGGRLLVREFEEQPASRLAVLVDAGEVVGREPETTFEDAVAVAASLVVYALGAGHPVQLFCDASEGARHLFEPGRLETLDWLARLEARGRLGLATAAGAMAFEIQRRSTSALIFPATRRNAGEALEAAAILQDRSARVIAVVVSARTYGTGGLSATEEETLLADLAATRTLVYRIAKGEDLSECLRQPLVG